MYEPLATINDKILNKNKSKLEINLSERSTSFMVYFLINYFDLLLEAILQNQYLNHNSVSKLRSWSLLLYFIVSTYKVNDYYILLLRNIMILYGQYPNVITDIDNIIYNCESAA